MDQPVLTDLFVVEVEQLPVPVSGRSSVARKCSESGKVAVRLKAGSQAARIRELLRGGALTDQEIAAATRLPLTTVLARRWALIHNGLVEEKPVGFQQSQTALRSLWGLTEKGRQG